MAWDGSIADITSCCINQYASAWITCSNGLVFCTEDITVPGSAWNLLSFIPMPLIQISCTTHINAIIAGVNEAGELWYADQNITTAPNWKRCTSAPPLKSVSISSDGTCNVTEQKS